MDNKITNPLSTLQWVSRGRVKPNDYNPNKVSKQNLELLKQSILSNGLTVRFRSLSLTIRISQGISTERSRTTGQGERTCSDR